MIQPSFETLCPPPFPNIWRIGLTMLTFDLDLNINRGHLLIKDYLPTTFKLLGQSVLELSVAQGVGDQPKNRQVQSPSFFWGGGAILQHKGLSQGYKVTDLDIT